jgi:hypothetical protein
MGDVLVRAEADRALVLVSCVGWLTTMGCGLSVCVSEVGGMGPQATSGAASSARAANMARVAETGRLVMVLID